MAIDLPGIDVGLTGSQSLSVGANGPVTASAPDRVPHDYPPTVNRLLAALAMTSVAGAMAIHQRDAPHGLAAGMKRRLFGA